VCISLGLVSGLALTWIEGLSTNMILLVLLIYASAAVGSVFIRETEKEQELKNIYEEIYREVDELPIRILSEPSSAPLDVPKTRFDNLLNDLEGIVKDNSKMGTLVGSPRGIGHAKLQEADF
jgi:Na+-transporting methylmalonyl-CoA/oxaloacetate decarboxylase gamma subunit